MDVDVVPVTERGEDLGVGFGVRRFEVAERLVGEDDAPAERVVRQVALDDGDLVPRVGLFQQQREIQARGAATDAEDAHDSGPCCRGAGPPRKKGGKPALRRIGFDLNILNMK